MTLPNGTQIDYVIDGQHRRIGKKINGTITQGWLYDGQLQIIAEVDGSGNVTSRFVYAEQAKAPSYMIKGGVTYRLISDNVGNPRLVVNTTDGSIVQRMDYDEFGRVTAAQTPASNLSASPVASVISTPSLSGSAPETMIRKSGDGQRKTRYFLQVAVRTCMGMRSMIPSISSTPTG